MAQGVTFGWMGINPLASTNFAYRNSSDYSGDENLVRPVGRVAQG